MQSGERAGSYGGGPTPELRPDVSYRAADEFISRNYYVIGVGQPGLGNQCSAPGPGSIFNKSRAPSAARRVSLSMRILSAPCVHSARAPTHTPGYREFIPLPATKSIRRPARVSQLELAVAGNDFAGRRAPLHASGGTQASAPSGGTRVRGRAAGLIVG